MTVDSQQLALADPDTASRLTAVEKQVEQPQRTARQFLQGIQHLVGGVAVVTTSDHDEWYGVTTTSVCTLSVVPPTLIACVPRRSGIGRQLGRTCKFCVNLLSFGQRTVAEIFADGDGLDVDRFRHGQWVPGATGSPVLKDGLVSFECGVDLMYGYPNHVVVIGSVKHVRHAPGPASPLVALADQFGHVMPAVP